MRTQIYFRLAVLGVMALSLSACDSIRREAGLTKQAPDEFAVVTKAPLIIPPNFNLRPPAPGAPPLNQEGPTDSAQAALFNGSDPATVAAGMSPNLSLGERMLLATAGAQNTDPAIRAELEADSRAAAAAADQSFTDRVLSGTLAPSTAPKKPEPKKASGGWFDWL
ncbi:MAG TPA: DUF3035 domain-containing protein [Rhizomicrobium sp.]|jgi:hypothetical protein|nr:DUF3035 domain-containing protein [Rhizomicrobium sp.]